MEVIANILMSTSSDFSILGDVNCPGTESTSVSPDLVSILNVFGLT